MVLDLRNFKKIMNKFEQKIIGFFERIEPIIVATVQRLSRGFDYMISTPERMVFYITIGYFLTVIFADPVLAIQGLLKGGSLFLFIIISKWIFRKILNISKNKIGLKGGSIK